MRLVSVVKRLRIGMRWSRSPRRSQSWFREVAACLVVDVQQGDGEERFSLVPCICLREVGVALETGEERWSL